MQTNIYLHYRKLSDEQLLQLVAQKDADAFEILYDRYAPALYNLTACMVRNDWLAEELLQDAFSQIWQKASQYEGSGSVSAWLHRIARNKVLDELRRQKAHAKMIDRFQENVDFLSMGTEPSAEAKAEQHWLYQQVRQALTQIPVEQRHCLELAYFDGLSQGEIAAQTHVPLGTIKTRIRIGMEKVGRILNRSLVFANAH